MQTSNELQSWVKTVADAASSLADAEMATRQDKARRQHSFFSRLYDWLFPTQAERQEASAASILASAKAKGQQAASDWIRATALHCLNENGADSSRRTAQLSRIDDLRRRHGQVGAWLKLSQDAMCKLSTAASDCQSASSTELIDLVTTNKTISLLSSLETSSAADSVRSANASVRTLSEALPKRGSASVVDEPSDFLDLAVDIAFEPSFDVLSWLNMGRLDDAAHECRRLSEQLSPNHERLERLAKESQAQLDDAIRVLSTIELPYLTAAAEHVPALIKCAAPTSI